MEKVFCGKTSIAYKQNDPIYNMAFLKCIEAYVNILLRVRDRDRYVVTFNEVLKYLGMEEDDKLGLLMGWAGKDDFIDFGIEDAENGEYRLDFNCRVLHWFDPCFPYILPPVSVDYE